MIVYTQWEKQARVVPGSSEFDNSLICKEVFVVSVSLASKVSGVSSTESSRSRQQSPLVIESYLLIDNPRHFDAFVEFSRRLPERRRPDRNSGAPASTESTSEILMETATGRQFFLCLPVNGFPASIV